MGMDARNRQYDQEQQAASRAAGGSPNVRTSGGDVVSLVKGAINELVGAFTGVPQGKVIIHDIDYLGATGSAALQSYAPYVPDNSLPYRPWTGPTGQDLYGPSSDRNNALFESVVKGFAEQSGALKTGATIGEFVAQWSVPGNSPVELAGLAGTGISLIRNALARRAAAQVAEQLAAQEAASLEKAVATGPKCFPAGTLVSTPQGEVKIENIKAGDVVWAYDFETRKTVEGKVSETVRNFTHYWIDITVGAETITATRSHPFWVESESRWVKAVDLKPGVTLRLQDGTSVAIATVQMRELQRAETTYNFEVIRHHDYYVGHTRVLVHNPVIMQPNPDAFGPHTTFKVDAFGQVTNYQTWVPQTNPQNPSPWQPGTRVDLQGKSEFNKVLQEWIDTPHAHDSNAPGGVRSATPQEIPGTKPGCL